MVCVSWQDAQAYAKWLSAQTGHTYRLPSEAEWEYAARGLRDSPRDPPRYSWGNEAEGCAYANGADLTGKDEYSNWSNIADCRDGHVHTAPVGSFIANAFRLSDMHGNVWEWVQDCWHDSYRGAPLDGRAWMAEDGGDCGQAVLRGGSWFSDPRYLRSAYRSRGWRGYRSGNVGFRLARTLPD